MKSFLKFSREAKRPQVTKREWMEQCVMELATPDTITEVIDKCIEAGLYAFDLETTGLDNRVFEGRTKDQIVGACLSPDGIHGYYLPVRHVGNGAKGNIPVSQFEAELRRLVNSKTIAIFHHGKFDHEFLQFCGGESIGEWDDPKVWEDSLILAFLDNSRLNRVGLKPLSDEHLNPNYLQDVRRRREGEKFPGFMIELEELFDPGHDRKKLGLDFSQLDPFWEPVVWYAASDAICTFRLYKKLYTRVVSPESGVSQRTIYNIEKMCCAATRWMERARVHIDQEKVGELTRLGQREYFDSIQAIYDFCEETLGRDVSPAWWHVLAKGVVYEGDKDNLPPLFDPENVENPINAQIEEAKKVVDHNRKRPAWDRSEPLAQIFEQEVRRLEKELSSGELHEFPMQYDVMSPRQLGPLFEEMEVPDLKRTEKSDQVMTTAGEMDRLTELHGDTFPFMMRIKRFREVQKALSQYLIPLRRDAHSDSTIRISYQAWKVDTGRFAAKGDKNPALNGGTSFPMHGAPATYDQSKPECLRRVRECITARPGRILVACFAEGTLVSTMRGLVPVEEVTNLDSVLLEKGGARVSWAGLTGTKPTVDIWTEMGFTVRVTPDHRILVVDRGLKWKQARDLQPGDTVVQLEGWGEPDFGRIYTSLSFAALLGRVFNSKTYRETLPLNGDEERLLHEIRQKMHCVPRCILQGPRPTVAAFLEGLFDGAVFDQSSVSLHLMSDVFSQGIQLLLLGLGIRAKRTWSGREWKLTITGLQNLERFRDQIGGKELLKLAIASFSDQSRLLDGPLMFDAVTVVRPGPTVRVYDVTVPTKGRLCVGGIVAHNCDYSGVELRIVSNLSREPKWITEYFRCSSCEKTFDRGDGKTTPSAPPPFCPRCGSDKIGDLHTLSAISFYGAEAQKDKKKFKHLRQNAKGANFALCYGGSGKAVCRSVGVDDNEGWRIYRQFTGTYKGLQAWWKKQHVFAKANSYVNTAFGRRYPVPDILLPKRDPKTGRENGAFIAKAERNSLNGPIQGTSADLTKLAMALVYKAMKTRGWLDKVHMTITIHDELVFEIEFDIVEAALEVIMPLMISNSAILKLKWPVPLTLDCELGFDWTVPWNLIEYQEGKQPWPEALKPLFPKAIAALEARKNEPDPEAGSNPESVAPPPDSPQEKPPDSPQEKPPDSPQEEKLQDKPKPQESSEAVQTTPTPETFGEPAASPETVPEASQAPSPPAMPSGELFVYRLRKPLRQGVVEALALVLHECKNRGSHPIEIRTTDGESVLWKSTEFKINPTQFSILADRQGI